MGGGIQYAHGIVGKVRSAHILEQVTTSSPNLNLGRERDVVMSAEISPSRLTQRRMYFLVQISI